MDVQPACADAPPAWRCTLAHFASPSPCVQAAREPLGDLTNHPPRPSSTPAQLRPPPPPASSVAGSSRLRPIRPPASTPQTVVASAVLPVVAQLARPPLDPAGATAQIRSAALAVSGAYAAVSGAVTAVAVQAAVAAATEAEKQRKGKLHSGAPRRCASSGVLFIMYGVLFIM